MCGLSAAVSTLAGWLPLQATTLEQYFETGVLVAGGRSKAFGVLKDGFSKGSDSDTSAVDPRNNRKKFDIASPEGNRKAMCLEVVQC